MSGFVFKQFKVAQTRSAMKVSTDGILLGAWADLVTAQRLLDVGTGTGLLALMCKQRKPCMAVSAVEIDENACADAQQNFANSPWPDIALVQKAIQQVNSITKFDVVISNPPYFNASLKGDDQARNTARHTDSLSFSELISAFKRLSHEKSFLNVILPCPEAQQFITQAQLQDLHLVRHCLVNTTKAKAPSRSLMCFAYQARLCELTHLTIHGEAGQYSDEYIALCKDFYLKM
ncbi:MULTISPECIES: tRNA1(Val) (adenine(37)-N6)-methyltransferase [Pseudoalteromonas]|uniref:tRNA1(Val) (adenine(37)-N6)-methyltransferase n=1 Tax=Pseudoalteromonas TaxID=53246 RepID=UPI0003027721|nr:MULTISPECIES: methyltransferase [Pseudoalteromonas]MCF6144751.1 tRNA1Val (adenine37-N6)-methyltransferase [Pseudoalteromonas mariniglutinosa NCIMB 1770]BDF95198.1 tRNA1(Val) (adenine(37)-N6)-methyltransferase [Pseudoalteromonas sp. KAN5]